MAPRRRLCFISCLFILAAPLHPSHGAAVERPTSFDLPYAEWLERHGLCGGLLASTWDGKAIRTVAFGNTRTDSRIVIASLSKAVTGAAILALIDDGKLHLDHTVGELLQRYFERFGPPADADVKALTLRQLLEHTSGARYGRHDPAGWFKFRPVHAKHGAGLTDRELLATILKNSDLVPSAGTKFTYSNFNYLVLGVIVAARSKRRPPKMLPPASSSRSRNCAQIRRRGCQSMPRELRDHRRMNATRWTTPERPRVARGTNSLAVRLLGVHRQGALCLTAMTRYRKQRKPMCWRSGPERRNPPPLRQRAWYIAATAVA
jgi:hypothetical protein